MCVYKQCIVHRVLPLLTDNLLEHVEIPSAKNEVYVNICMLQLVTYILYYIVIILHYIRLY